MITYEELYGITKAKYMRKLRSEFMKKNNPMKTEQGKLNSSISHTGYKHTEEQRKNESLAKKGITPKNINLWNELGKPTRFRKGHTPWNKERNDYLTPEIIKKMVAPHLGKKQSEEQKLKRNNKLRGQKRTYETKLKQSKARLGFKHKPESIEKYKEKRKNWKTPKYDTKIEVKIQNFLDELGIDYLKHKYMNIEHGYQCDIFIPSLNLVIECDGNYWHKFPTRTDIDHIRTSELLSEGFKVLRLWESEIKQMNLDKFKEEKEKCILQ